jgi:hypothetical protein
MVENKVSLIALSNKLQKGDSSILGIIGVPPIVFPPPVYFPLR